MASRRLVVVLGLAVAACGGDSPPLTFDTSPETTTATTAAAGTTSAATTSAATAAFPSTTAAAPVTTTAPLGPWVDVTANLTNMASECGNMSIVKAHPALDEVIAGVAGNGLFVNPPGTDQWVPLGTGGGTRVTNRGAAIVFDPADPQRFWESGSYGAPGMVRTADGGQTFEALGGIDHLDAMSVDLTDPEHRTILVGAHERPELYRSIDGGASFTNIADRLPADVGSSMQPLVLGPDVHLVGTFGAAQSGIYRTTDGGGTWQLASDLDVYNPPLVASDGAIYWLTVGDGGVVRSTDGGVTWNHVHRGGLESGVVELPNGRLASIADSEVVVSADQGATWMPAGGPKLPFAEVPSGITYSPTRNAVYVWRADCTSVLPAGAIQRLDLASA